MAMEDFAREIALQAKRMSPKTRIAKTRKLASSPETKKFIQKYLPELYAEAFPSSGSAVGSASESHPPRALYAKRS